MDKKPLFEFDMSVSSDKKRRTKGRKASTGAVDTSKQVCEKEGCNKSGKYRAPKSACLLYTSDAADDSLRVDLGGRRIIKKTGSLGGGCT